MKRGSPLAGGPPDNSHSDRNRSTDRFLEALRACGSDQYRADPECPDLWHAYCPSCAGCTVEVRRLTVRETLAGDVTFSCSTGCNRESILDALELAERRYPRTEAGSVAAATIELADAELAGLREERRVVRLRRREVAHVAP